MLDMKKYIVNMPKAELHIHIEGMINPEMLLELAERNIVEFPYSSVEEIEAAQDFGEPALENFLKYHYNCLKVVKKRQDLYDITIEYMERCNKEKIRHVEIQFDPQAFTERDIGFEEIITGLQKGRTEGYRKYGISSNLIMCAQRDLSEESALNMLDQAKPYKDLIIGVGLDSVEEGNPPLKFEKYFKRAKEEGYRLTAHCDCYQKESVKHIGQCINQLDIERIDHGCNVVDSEELINASLEKNICFTMCPTQRPSDSKPRRLEGLKKMYDCGLLVTINSDDPAEYPTTGYLTKMLIEVQAHSKYSALDIYKCMRNAFEGAWLDETTRQKYIQELDNYAFENNVLDRK